MVAYKYWNGGWIDVGGTNAMGFHGTCCEGQQAEYITAEECDTVHKEGWGG